MYPMGAPGCGDLSVGRIILSGEHMENVQWVRSLLREMKVAPQRLRGQNFLLDEQVISRIVASAALGSEDTVIEIGPGLGSMSRLLTDRPGRTILIELEPAFARRLTDIYAFQPQVQVLEADAATFPYAAFCQEQEIAHYHVVANLPYQVTTPILKQLLFQGGPWQSMTLMLQKEAARRIVRGKGRENGPLTLLTEYFSEGELLFDVPPRAFYPAPAVTSTVIRLIRRQNPPVQGEIESLYPFIEKAFLQRRKVLVNSLAGAYGLSREAWVNLLADCGFNPAVRGEELSLADFDCILSRLKVVQEENA